MALAGIDPAVYARALADVQALRPLGTYHRAPDRLEPTEGPDCGTRRGYQRHRRDGEDACERCKTANTAADRRLRETGTSTPMSGDPREDSA